MKCDTEIDSQMQELVQLVLEKKSSSAEMDAGIKQSFLDVTRSFYYTAHFDPTTIDRYINKVLFEAVEY